MSLRTSPLKWCGNPFPHAFPSGEGGSCVPRKRETDEGHLPLPLGEVPEAERAFLPSQSLRDSSHRVGAKGERRERIVTGGNPWKGPHHLSGLVHNDTFYSGAPASAMLYVIRRTLEKVSYNLLKYFARGETTKFIRPILWEMTFFASEP